MTTCSRAAELTGTSNNPLSFQDLGGFAQFAGPSVAGIALPSRSSSPSVDSDPMASSAHLNAELLVILKKVSKRDATTKLKALEELEAYLKENTSDISAIVPTWVSIHICIMVPELTWYIQIRMYGKLTIEVDRRVRLAANNVHVLIATNAKKKLAPHLKEFIGAWILTLFDQSPDVAKCAQSSFEVESWIGLIRNCTSDIYE